MEINKAKLKIKYILGSFKDDPNYPSVDDMLYQIINFCYLNNKDSIISDVEICKIFNVEDCNSILMVLQKENCLLFDKELKNKKNYKIIKNPFA